MPNPQGLQWSYAYGAGGRVIAETDFDGRDLRYDLDPLGQVVRRTTPTGETIHYERDLAGRVTRKSVDGRTTSYAYAPGGQLLHASSPDGDLSYQYDRSGRVKTELADGRVTTHAYDTLGRRTRRVTPSGQVTTYAYDAAGQLVRQTSGGHEVNFDRDSAGRELSRRFGEMLTFTTAWDAAGRVAGQETSSGGRSLNRRTYDYRADGMLIGIDDELSGPRRFDLDPAGRVTAVHADGWSETYAYDEAGNQTAASWPGTMPGQEATGPRTYTGTRITRAGDVRYEHDAAGRIVLRRKTRLSRKPDIWRYTWDAEDRLTGLVTPDGTRWRYLYDPLGRRTAKQRLAPDGVTVAEQTTFTWDGTNLCEQTTTSTGLPYPVVLTWDHSGMRPLAQTERITTADASQEEVDRRFFAIVTDLLPPTGVRSSPVRPAGRPPQPRSGLSPGHRTACPAPRSPQGGRGSARRCRAPCPDGPWATPSGPSGPARWAGCAGRASTNAGAADPRAPHQPVPRPRRGPSARSARASAPRHRGTATGGHRPPPPPRPRRVPPP